ARPAPRRLARERRGVLDLAGARVERDVVAALRLATVACIDRDAGRGCRGLRQSQSHRLPIADLRRGALEELLERQSSGERRGLSAVGRVGSRVAGAPGGGYAAATNVRGPLVVRSARRTAHRRLLADAAVHEIV